MKVALFGPVGFFRCFEIFFPAPLVNRAKIAYAFFVEFNVFVIFRADTKGTEFQSGVSSEKIGARAG